MRREILECRRVPRGVASGWPVYVGTEYAARRRRDPSRSQVGVRINPQLEGGVELGPLGGGTEARILLNGALLAAGQSLLIHLLDGIIPVDAEPFVNLGRHAVVVVGRQRHAIIIHRGIIDNPRIRQTIVVRWSGGGN